MSITTAELNTWTDKTVSMSSRTEALSFYCRVLAAKTAYGDLRLLVRPVEGYGQVWVSAKRVKLVPAAPAKP